MTVEFQLLVVFVAQRVQIHLAAFDEFVKERKG